jgi:hypothetical protein
MQLTCIFIRDARDGESDARDIDSQTADSAPMADSAMHDFARALSRAGSPTTARTILWIAIFKRTFRLNTPSPVSATKAIGMAAVVFGLAAENPRIESLRVIGGDVVAVYYKANNPQRSMISPQIVWVNGVAVSMPLVLCLLTLQLALG